MDINGIMQAIATVGFPIVACGAMFWLMEKQQTNHKEELAELRKSIDNNTIIITKLYERIDKNE